MQFCDSTVTIASALIQLVSVEESAHPSLLVSESLLIELLSGAVSSGSIDYSTYFVQHSVDV
jgi:hypothetical protein